jgi:geranylgeranyl diphosphate synthase type II
LALNAGDTLTLLSLKPLLENRAAIGEALALRIIAETERMGRECAEGQALELGWRRYNSTAIDDADYLEMVLKKTCWLATIYPVRVGALIGSRGAVDLEPFIRFGFFLGTAFQIQDDLLNLTADSSYGKEINGDLWEGKRTLILIHALHEASATERERLCAILALTREGRTQNDIAWMRELVDRYECAAYARQIANGLAGAALHEYSLLSAGLPASRDKSFLEQMPTWVLERS